MMEEKEITNFEQKWKTIDDLGFAKLLEYAKNPKNKEVFGISKVDYLTLYTQVYDILMSKNNEVRNLCYQRLVSTLKFHCESIYEKMKNSNSVLIFIDYWISYENIVLNWVIRVFSYLARIKSLMQRNVTLENELNKIFKNEIYDKLSNLLKEDFLKIIDSSRKGENVDFHKLKTFIHFLSYFEENDFIEVIIQSHINYYTNLAEINLKDSYIDYLEFGKKILDTEQINLPLYLPIETVNLIIKKLTEIIFYNKSQLILYFNDGFKYLLNNEAENREKLIYTFEIFSKNETTVSILLNLFKEFSKTKLNELLIRYELNTELKSKIPPKDIATKTDFLQKYLIFQENMSNIISCFKGNNLFNVVFKEVLEEIQSNQDNINTSYLLPFYFDQYLKNSSGISLNSNSSIEGINQGLLIFPYISEKDVFIDIHQYLLSKRLINNDTKIDCEMYLISILKTQCGVDYTTKVEGMVNDYLKDKEMNHNYQVKVKEICDENNNISEKINNNENNKVNDNNNNIENSKVNESNKVNENNKDNDNNNVNENNNVDEKNNNNSKENNNYNIDDESKKILKEIDSSFLVLSSENWPSNINRRKITIPKKLEVLINFMTNFYKENYKGRILQWSFINSLMEIDFSILNKQYTLICNSFQGIILLYFNNPLLQFKNAIKEENLIKELKFEEKKDFNNSIGSLLKIKLILKDENNNSYYLNKNFTFNAKRIKLINEVNQEEYIKKEKIKDERNEAIDGTIIRILKSKTKIGHNDLINAVLSQLDRFKIKIASIKARIDSLISRELISRDKDDPNIYVYSTNEN